jgi:hypothetical protein
MGGGLEVRAAARARMAALREWGIGGGKAKWAIGPSGGVACGPLCV